jgi:hypothetical protein
MTPEENLLADLNEVSHDLRNWAEVKLDEGCKAQEIIDLFREASRIAFTPPMTRYITIAALIERDRRNRRLARVAATVAAAGLALAVIALPIGWMLTW